ncbi:MAG: DUF3516 domain-containing protein, partial [Allobranchiibius sp.]
YFAEHDVIGDGSTARGPAYLQIQEGKETWEVRQVIEDPAGDHDWGIDAQLPIAACDDAGTAVVVVLGLNRLDH